MFSFFSPKINLSVNLFTLLKLSNSLSLFNPSSFQSLFLLPSLSQFMESLSMQSLKLKTFQLSSILSTRWLSFFRQLPHCHYHHHKNYLSKIWIWLGHSSAQTLALHCWWNKGQALGCGINFPSVQLPILTLGCCHIEPPIIPCSWWGHKLLSYGKFLLVFQYCLNNHHSEKTTWCIPLHRVRCSLLWVPIAFCLYFYFNIYNAVLKQRLTSC